MLLLPRQLLLRLLLLPRLLLLGLLMCELLLLLWLRLRLLHLRHLRLLRLGRRPGLFGLPLFVPAAPRAFAFPPAFSVFGGAVVAQIGLALLLFW